MRRNVLVLSAVLLLAAAGVLVWQLRAPASSTASTLPTQPLPPPRPTATTPPSVTTANPTPTLPEAAPATAPTAPVVVQREGMTITDHRDNPTAAKDPTPVINTPGGRLLPPLLANQLADVIMADLKGCAELVPAADRNTGKPFGVTVKVGIAKGKLAIEAIDEAGMVGVPPKSAEKANVCLRDKLVGAGMPTTEADISGYPINLTFMPKT